MASKSTSFKNIALTRNAPPVRNSWMVQTAARAAIRATQIEQSEAGRSYRRIRQATPLVSYISSYDKAINTGAALIQNNPSIDESLDILLKNGIITTKFKVSASDLSSIRKFSEAIEKYFANLNTKNLTKLSFKELQRLKKKFKDDEEAVALLNAFCLTKRYTVSVEKNARAVRRTKRTLMMVAREYFRGADEIGAGLDIADTVIHGKQAIMMYHKLRLKSIRSKTKRVNRKLEKVKNRYSSLSNNMTAEQDARLNKLQKKEETLNRQSKKLSTKEEKLSSKVTSNDPAAKRAKKIGNVAKKRVEKSAAKAFGNSAASSAGTAATNTAGGAAGASTAGTAASAGGTAGGISIGVVAWIVVVVILVCMLLLMLFSGIAGMLEGPDQNLDSDVQAGTDKDHVSTLLTNKYWDTLSQETYYELIEKDIALLYDANESENNFGFTSVVGKQLSGYWNPSTQAIHTINEWTNTRIIYTGGDGSTLKTMPDTTSEILVAALVLTSENYLNLSKTFKAYASQLWADSHTITHSYTSVYACDSGCLAFSYKCSDSDFYSNLESMVISHSTPVVPQNTDGGCSEDNTCPGHIVNICLGHVDMTTTICTHSMSDESNSLFAVDTIGNTTGDNLSIDGTGEIYSWDGWSDDARETAKAICAELSDYTSGGGSIYWSETAAEVTAEMDRLTLLMEYTVSKLTEKYTPNDVLSENIVEGYWDPTTKQAHNISCWTRSSTVFKDGSGYALPFFKNNTGDILCMGLVFTEANHSALTKTFKEYCISLWNNSHSYTYVASHIYSCKDGCVDTVYYCNDSVFFDNKSKISIKHIDEVPYSEQGCDGNGGCNGHRLTCCTGHIDLNVTVYISSIHDSSRSIFDVDTIGNAVGTNLSLEGTGEVYSWNGWTDEQKEYVILLFDNMW